MKLSLSLFVITLALSATTTAYGAEAVTGAVDKNGVACQALDTECSKEYDVPGGEDDGPSGDGPDGDGPGDEGDFVIENRCPLYPSVGGECDGNELVNVICANKTTKTRFECDNNVFVITTDDVGQAFTDQPTAAPIPGTAGPAVIMKDAEETDVSGIDIGIDDSAAASTTAIVSSIVGITAAVGVVALL